MNPIRKLAARVGNPLEWSSVDKCLAIIAVWLLIALSTPLSLYFLPREVGASLAFGNGSAGGGEEAAR